MNEGAETRFITNQWIFSESGWRLRSWRSRNVAKRPVFHGSWIWLLATTLAFVRTGGTARARCTLSVCKFLDV